MAWEAMEGRHVWKMVSMGIKGKETGKACTTYL